MSIVWNTVQRLWDTLLQSLGLSTQKQGSLLFLGLDNAGKTTLLHSLKTGGEIRSFPPTDRPAHHDRFAVGRVQFAAWDLGGHEAVRYLWQDYVSTVPEHISAVLFLIDAADHDRLEEAAYELDALLAAEDGLVRNIPVAILLNKCDLIDQALTTEDIQQRIEYPRLQDIHGADKLAMYRISVLQGVGYQEAFQWISGFL